MVCWCCRPAAFNRFPVRNRGSSSTSQSAAAAAFMAALTPLARKGRTIPRFGEFSERNDDGIIDDVWGQCGRRISISRGERCRRTSRLPADDIRLSPIHGGFHLSGRSGGTSLVVLPQQFELPACAR